jgi:hypothetical protein
MAVLGTNGFGQKPANFISKCSEDRMGVSRNIYLMIGEVKDVDIKKSTGDSYVVQIPNSFIPLGADHFKITMDGEKFGSEGQFILNFDQSFSGNFITTRLVDKDNKIHDDQNVLRNKHYFSYMKETNGEKAEFVVIGDTHYRIVNDTLSTCVFNLSKDK